MLARVPPGSYIALWWWKIFILWRIFFSSLLFLIYYRILFLGKITIGAGGSVTLWIWFWQHGLVSKDMLMEQWGYYIFITLFLIYFKAWFYVLSLESNLKQVSGIIIIITTAVAVPAQTPLFFSLTSYFIFKKEKKLSPTKESAASSFLNLNHTLWLFMYTGTCLLYIPSRTSRWLRALNFKKERKKVRGGRVRYGNNNIFWKEEEELWNEVISPLKHALKVVASVCIYTYKLIKVRTWP